MNSVLQQPIKFIGLFLDDTREPTDVYSDTSIQWTIVRTVDDAIKFILDNKDKVDFISLDNDLGLDIQEGYHLVLWMIETNTWPNFSPVVHSRNVVRNQYMKDIISRYGPYNGEKYALPNNERPA